NIRCPWVLSRLAPRQRNDCTPPYVVPMANVSCAWRSNTCETKRAQKHSTPSTAVCRIADHSAARGWLTRVRLTGSPGNICTRRSCTSGVELASMSPPALTALTEIVDRFTAGKRRLPVASTASRTELERFLAERFPLDRPNELASLVRSAATLFE